MFKCTRLTFKNSTNNKIEMARITGNTYRNHMNMAVLMQRQFRNRNFEKNVDSTKKTCTSSNNI